MPLVKKAAVPEGQFATPDITTAQIVAMVPVLANFLHVFGVYSLSAAQTSALKDTLALAGVLILGDAGIRIGRAVGNNKKAG